MYLLLVTAFIAVCGADKLDRTYLPPASANTAGGSPGSLQTPFRSSNQGLGGLPKGGYSNNFDGVVVDAAAPGTRASGSDETGLGGPRVAYGSTDSKVGDAAFTANTAFPRIGSHSGLNSQAGRIPASDQQVPGRGAPERAQAPRDRASNTVKYENDVSHDSFNYAFETDNGIVAEEIGVEVNGVKAQGGYSYTGDDGQVYSVTYTADEAGYRPTGDHLPTPPPIPAEILKSLEQNAKEEATGVVDDGSYDAQKYNTGEDYTKSDSANEKYNSGQANQVGNRPQTNADGSGLSVIQNSQAFGRPNFNQFGSHSFDTSSNGESKEYNFGVTVSASSFGQNGQKIVFDSGSKNEYLPPGSAFNQDRSSEQNSNPQGTKSNQQIEYTQGNFLSRVNNNVGLNTEQNSQIQNFVPLSQQKLQDDNNLKRPFGSSPVFGKPTIIDSALSIKDPFRPSSNRHTQNNQSIQKPHAAGITGGSFEVVSGNVYSSKNGYFGPRNQFNKPGQNGNVNFKATSGNSNSPSVSAFASVSRPNVDFQSLNKNLQQISLNPPSVTNKNLVNSNTPSVFAFASASRPATGFQSIQLQDPQYNPQISNARLPSNQNQDKMSSSPSSISNFNRGPLSPTLQPQTELTTPLESNSDQNKDSVPIPVFDGPDSPSLNGFSNLPSFGFNSHDIQKASPTQASAYAFSSNNGYSVASGLSKPESIGSNLNGVFPNSSPFDVQYSSSTLKPSYTQSNQKLGSDDSYYYNKPSKPFNVPTIRPQISRFPSSSFDQPFRVTQTPFGTRPQLADFPQTSFPPSLEPASPTLPSNLADQNSNTLQSEFNRVTQASVSSFPVPVPTEFTSLHRNHFNSQFNTRPSQQSKPLNQQTQTSNLFNTPTSSFAQATVDISSQQGPNQRLQGLSKTGTSHFQQSQQYGGEVYEYKKPPQMLPLPQNSAFAQQIEKNSQVGSHVAQYQNSGNYKPSSQVEYKFTEQKISPVGQVPQNSQVSQGNQAFNSNTQVQSQHTLFGSELPKPIQDSHVTQGVHTFNPNSQTQSQSDLISSQFDSMPLKPTQTSQISPGSLDFNTEKQGQPQSESRPGNLGSLPKETQHIRPSAVQGASKFPPKYQDEGPSCCKQANIGSQSSQTDQQNQSQFGSQIGSNQKDTSPPQFSVSSFASVGESFGRPRKPPSFDETGYHY